MEYLVQSQKVKTDKEVLKQNGTSDKHIYQPVTQKQWYQTSVQYMEKAPVQKIKIEGNQIPADISSRDNGPKWIGSIPLGEDDLTRHHIIPFKLIHDFFNLAIRTIEAQSLPKDKINKWLLTAIHTAKDTQESVGWEKFDLGMDDERFSEIKDDEVSDNDTPISVAKLKLLDAAISWMPGNIFIGPTCRMDDSKKGDEIDESAKYLIGEAQYQIYQQTYDAMLHFMKDQNQQEELMTALDGLKKIAERREPYSYEDTRSAWTRIKDGEDLNRLEVVAGSDKTVGKNIRVKRGMIEKHNKDRYKPNPDYFIPSEYVLNMISGGPQLLAVLLKFQTGRVRGGDDKPKGIGELCEKKVFVIRKYQWITFYVEDVIDGCKQIVRSDKRETIVKEIIDLAYAINRKQED